tara:strand:- start:219 stop:725 length:507 start_codon:yes stop_codon:yes gene_type:complete
MGYKMKGYSYPGKAPEKSSPVKFDWKNALDNTQTALTAAGMIPGVGMIADGINTATSLGRAGYAKATGDKQGVKDHMVNAGVNAAMMVPVVGQGVAGTKLAYSAGKEVVKQGGKKLAKEVGKKAIKKTVNKGSKKIIKETDKVVNKKSGKNNSGITILKTDKKVKNIA